ncbi:hypothetical protein P43SY_009142 [Pythium insidiosum]|uniref:Multidrug resistance protein ABC superfamily n=1 Tax=Pythium insidiosum TaxID=114742 RepID=A0AAD5LLR0_PYTIN|nr:hypothetical protein P43SY_009142 [Pythium insidiosum]
MTTTPHDGDAPSGGTDTQPSERYVQVVTPKDQPDHEDPARTVVLSSGDDSSDGAGSGSGSGASSRLPGPAPSVSLRELYRYASPCDHALLAVGCGMAVVNGTLYPFMAMLFGRAIDSFEPLDLAAIRGVALAYLGIALALFVSDYVAHVCLQTTAERQVQALRIHYVRHVLHREVAWFESRDAAPELTTQLATATLKIQDGLGVKSGEVLRCVTQFVAGYAIGFAAHWGVSIVMVSVMPLMAICLSWIIKTLRERTAVSQRRYAEAGAIAEETLRALRTVRSFNAEPDAVRRYQQKAAGAEAENVRLARVLSVVLGVFFGTVWVTYAVGLWYGASLVGDRETDPKTVFTAFYGILIGTISLAQVTPNLAAVVTAKAAATSLYAVLAEPSAIDASATQRGLVPAHCAGRVEFEDVSFAYPSRPDAVVLRQFSLELRAGETVALVGPSGGGKSTVVALLQRFYDPTSGRVLLDGHELPSLQLRWLRRQIGLVAQEPVLFATTIFENIAAAAAGDEDEEEQSQATSDKLGRRSAEATMASLRARVEAAARQANIHEFIESLPDGYATMVGERGVTLSGGQKQRIAIARALVRDARVLILDEATSALDTESEAAIQLALDALIARTHCTTLIIAHRLSTIRRATRICVVVDGAIVESGTHAELLAREHGQFLQLAQSALLDAPSTQPRDASLVWSDSLHELQVSVSARGAEVPGAAVGAEGSRESSVAMLAATFDSKRSDGAIERAMLTPGTTCDGPSGSKQGRASASEAQSLVVASVGAQDTAASPSTSIVRVVRRLMAFSVPERRLHAVGLVAAVLNGLSFPASAVLLSEIVAIMVRGYAQFQATGEQRVLDVLYDAVQRDALLYAVGALAVGVITFVQSYAFKKSSERLVTRLRDAHFRALCRQDMAFFDDPARGSGALARDLAVLPSQAALLAGDAQGRVLQAATTFLAALVVSFWLGSWLLSCVMCVVLPVLSLAHVVRVRTMKGGGGRGAGQSGDDNAEDADRDLGRANALAAEAVAQIRTVAALGLERRMTDAYRQLSLRPLRRAARQAHVNGVALGFSSFAMFAVYALVFWCGGLLVQRHEISFAELMRSLMAIMLSANGVGQAASHLTDVDDAKRAADRILALVDRRPLASHSRSTTDDELVPPVRAVGRLELRDVFFAYPSRPQTLVLRGLSLTVEPGQLVALCGPSGGGKSTVLALLERFYDPLRGDVSLDRMPLATLSTVWLRAQLGLIAQEPVLFAGTIHDNIAYGRRELDGSPCDVSREDVERAAEIANAHAFVSALPEGYDTVVGGHSDQLSGGQKQRLAIARAVLKDAPILLLDEATSALDAESEQLVQDALERVIKMRRRTTLVIAHRMRTVRHADKICVIAQGRVLDCAALLGVCG